MCGMDICNDFKRVEHERLPHRLVEVFWSIDLFGTDNGCIANDTNLKLQKSDSNLKQTLRNIWLFRF